MTNALFDGIDRLSRQRRAESHFPIRGLFGGGGNCLITLIACNQQYSDLEQVQWR